MRRPWRTRSTGATPSIVSSQPTSVVGSSVGSRSVSQSDTGHEPSEPSVPELDNDVSTDDFTSDYLTTESTTEPEHHQMLNPSQYGASPPDVVSVFSPTRQRAASIPYRSERSFGDEGTINSTRSINELDVNYIYENGRRYCGSYYMPNDEDEQVRLQLINQVYLKTFDGELSLVPLESPTHILDVGTAVGEWAIDIAEQFPDCEVTGTDISNIFERRAPPNVFWEIDDAELHWERPSDHYDLIHFRNMTGAFSSWQHIYQSAFTCLKPGGWVEILDVDEQASLRSLASFFEAGSLASKVASDLQHATVLSGRPSGVGHLEPRLLVNLGYVDVQLTEFAIPLRTQDGSTGKFWLLAMLNGMEPTCMRLLTKYKGWDPDEVRVACDMMGEEMMSMALNPRKARSFVAKVRVLVGRKPGWCSRWSIGPVNESGEVTRSSPDDMSNGGAVGDVEGDGHGYFSHQAEGVSASPSPGVELGANSDCLSRAASGHAETDMTSTTEEAQSVARESIEIGKGAEEQQCERATSPRSGKPSDR
ncbi:S-adenosyl-L-methionine-dependent methyltransferase [Xylariomycetidae sp. FL2044]|nr:S-adenosyl-L-methionine-dependent methyltransferase [Xylariomycetidae sp. FL2044]